MFNALQHPTLSTSGSIHERVAFADAKDCFGHDLQTQDLLLQRGIFPSPIFTVLPNGGAPVSHHSELFQGTLDLLLG
jgi:hypothetical protein